MTTDEINQILVQSSEKIRRIATKRLRPGVDLDDLHQVGLISVWKTLQRHSWDPSGKASLVTYCYQSILFDCIRELNHSLPLPGISKTQLDLLFVGDRNFPEDDEWELLNIIESKMKNHIGFESFMLFHGIDSRGPLSMDAIAPLVGLKDGSGVEYRIRRFLEDARKHLGLDGAGSAP